MTANRLQLTVYTDYKSPYAYVAKNAAKALAVEYPVDLTWLPYTLRIAEYLDAVDSRSAHNWRKVKYAYMDARRLANRQGLVLKGPKRIYEGRLSSIGMLFAQKAGFFEAYNDLTFERFWRHDLDIDSMDEMKAHVALLGGSAADYAAYADGPGDAEHRAIVEAAEAAGVFGVPMIVLNGELFWGGDRIDALKRRIEDRLEAGGAAARTADRR
ncbi:DsbA family protein [Quisquiliibacterium transsilvanicum]|uniref:2-hydroxychromene-2-carboxylate isomerase n=1 Tax=Quisquiliibacterium transsilvanicum TaxID=1549638 RepID=A0A7W8HJ29_9BURK|nr:DsbA family protein [Quisquiliibacterium transsilvanicum]MBB5272797.1 2-hydroxychromene-2-carboxylate isomerase [Quisquiliibacterium transsilvanicum]